ncbi:hypothetical protein CGCSCA4_v000111 [Colletotrichum siamense]|uniref:Uncharacterized protein n=1 Tax=Colletotrichum siamense TaxID=690259 RepID=A0A9P5EYM5_COLSI|nr:hypothetical protein CGCSCA4_v000111 [Colletotrichum siamense]KAF4862119.1 hypothetical protein CGCSCA2_v003929 [Colletotrichum siamense]
MHSTKFLAAILAVAGTGLAMPLEAPIAIPASPSAAVEGLKESWVGCDNGHCPDNFEERWAAKKAKMPKKTSKPKDLSPEEFEKEVDEFWAEKIQKFQERLAAKKANTPESPPKPADSPCNKDKRDAAVDAACATDDDGFRKLSPEALSAILNAAPGPVVAKSMPAAADKILPNDAIEKIRGRPGPGVIAPTAAFSGPFKLTKRPARTSSATGKPTASSATGTPTVSLATVSSTAATATGTTTPKVTSVGVTGTPARPSPATGTATNTTGTATGTTAPTKAHLAARDYPSNFADLVRVGPQIEKKTATAIPANMTSQEYCAPRIEKIRQKGIEAGDKVGEPSMATKRAELKAMVGCIIEILTDAWIGPENAKPTATPAPNAPDCAYIMEEGVKEIMAKGDAAVEDNEAFQQCVFAEAMSQSSALEKRGRITHIPVLDAATRERLIKEGEIIVLTGKRKPGTKPKHHQS